MMEGDVDSEEINIANGQKGILQGMYRELLELRDAVSIMKRENKELREGNGFGNGGDRAGFNLFGGCRGNFRGRNGSARGRGGYGDEGLVRRGGVHELDQPGKVARGVSTGASESKNEDENGDASGVGCVGVCADAPGGITNERVNRDAGHGPTWASIVSNNHSVAKELFGYYPPSTENLKRVVSPPPEIQTEGLKDWSATLVGHFVDKKLPFYTVNSIAQKLWSAHGLREVLATEKGFFFFKFESEKCRDEVFEQGPWHFLNRPMVMQKWKEGMEMHKDSVDKIPLWIKLFNVPMEFWTPRGLSYLASAVGKPLCADAMTLAHKRISYARVCVEVGVNDELVSEFDLKLLSGKCIPIFVEYQWKPLVCKECHKFGHSIHNCPLKRENLVQSQDHKAKVGAHEQAWRMVTKKGTVVEHGEASGVGQEIDDQHASMGNNVVITEVNSIGNNVGACVLQPAVRVSPNKFDVLNLTELVQDESNMQMDALKSELDGRISSNKFALLNQAEVDETKVQMENPYLEKPSSLVASANKGAMSLTNLGKGAENNKGAFCTLLKPKRCILRKSPLKASSVIF